MAPPTSAVTITIPQGALRGSRCKSLSGRPFSSFQGIPYAKPPVGHLRFKSPQPAEKWSGIRNATKEGNIAPQIDFLFRLQTEYEGDEDCLYLNVYTPKLPTGDNTSLLPVMVWIHGGGYFLGSGNSEVYGPDYLMENDVVLVTINYRLGVLGFLSTGDEVVPGNAGIKDQIMALRWVKNNIKHFGGDPENVTIFGESAGSFSCQILMLSPATKGLFHRVICQSGTLREGDVTNNMKDRSIRLAKFLGFSGSSSDELFEFMKEQPAKKLVEHAAEGLSKEEKEIKALMAFRPTLESYTVPDSVLTQDPIEIMKSGAFHRVPLMVGVTSREGFIYGQLMKNDPKAIRNLNANFQKTIPGKVSLNDALMVKRFYFGNQPLDESAFEAMVDFRTDMFFTYPTLRTAETLSSQSTMKPVYFYNFDIVTRLNIYKKQAGAEEYSGASHCDELPYLFSCKKTKDMPKGPDTIEGKSIARMTRLWTNFAKTGNPTPDPQDTLLPVIWTQFKKNEGWYLDITNDGVNIKKDLKKEQMEIWKKVYKV